MPNGVSIRPSDGATLSHVEDERKHPPELGEVVARLSALLGPRQGSVQQLSGGITNRNFKVNFGGTDYVVRLPGKDTSKLGIDRGAECSANKRASELGIAPRVAAMIPDPPCLVTFFIEGRAAEPDELRNPEGLKEVATSLRSFHDSGEQLSTDFDSFQIVRDYAETAEQNDVTLPDGYKPALACAKSIAKAMRGDEHEPVPCHNDLLAANFLHEGNRIQIVDWEYAGMGDRYFDLGNFAVNNELDEDAEARFLEAYFGEAPDQRRRATLRVMRYMSDFREAMWGLVQSGISEIDFDFPGYARKHFDRLAAAAEEPRFKKRIKEAGGGRS
jgi:thiamine kinase-like enzyme